MPASMVLASCLAPRVIVCLRARPARSVRVAAGKFTKIGEAAGASGGDASGEAPETPSPAKLEIVGRVGTSEELYRGGDSVWVEAAALEAGAYAPAAFAVGEIERLLLAADRNEVPCPLRTRTCRVGRQTCPILTPHRTAVLAAPILVAAR